jgi:hypothetical protein
MARLSISLREIDEQHLGQLEYALAFASEDVLEWRIDAADRALHVSYADEADAAAVEAKLQQLVDRYRESEFGHKELTYFEQEAKIQRHDAWQGLLDRRWASPVGDGHVILRGEAAELMEMLDAEVTADLARRFGPEVEVYPATIQAKTLDRCNHFTSFPEHVDFVAHLRSDVGNLQDFARLCREEGWSPDLHEGRMGEHVYAISPSCCYHCYEGMEGWELEPPGRCITAVLGCHRFEGANQISLSRLRAFTMREIVWVGHPKFVLDGRREAEQVIVEQARRWGLHCRLETANDMFFTDDYAVKASFQRQQEAKKELRAFIPQEDRWISVISSNFHAATFGKAFDIKVKGRPAASACVGWGLERLIYAVYSQFGFDTAAWPPGLRDGLAAHRSRREAG